MSYSNVMVENSPTSIRLNLGCGPQTPEGWINVDYALGAQIAKLPIFSALSKRLGMFNLDWDEKILICDLRKQFPWSDNSVDCIYSSHTLEHFSKDEGRQFLQECHRVLKPNGVIRIVVPDLNAIIDQYKQGVIPAVDLLDVLEATSKDPGDSPVKKLLAPLVQFPHKCMYDTQALIDTMSGTGFVCQGGIAFESEIPNVRAIELPERIEAAVIVEGKKVGA